MENSLISVIGIMSGTSMDGLDIACCEFDYVKGQWKGTIKKATTISYSKKMLKELTISSTLSGKKLTALDITYGKWIGTQVKAFIEENKLEVSLIASHGHTVFHQPEEKISLQIGNLNAIYQEVKIPTVNNFRQLDILKGGQGAPLVPIGDQLLFSEFNCCLNLGGIANISYLDNQNSRIAYDISVCNLLLNKLANTQGMAFDTDGLLAKSGLIQLDLLKELNAIDYYNAPHPKSLGIEQLNAHIFPLVDKYARPMEDIMATAVEHIAFQISENIKKCSNKGTVLITGGGAHNITLMSRIGELSGEGIIIAQANDQLIDYKEAMVFAFLGLLRVRQKVNVLSSVTGASSDSIAGDYIGEVNI